jgi:phosphatidylserine/phosphatidylglycerophosphate/cardiolipin synthase-like enzyme
MLYVEPDAGTAPVVTFIEAAKSQLMLNVYYIDQPDILQAIGADVNRGVKVYVQIAGNPFGMGPGQLQAEESAITQTGAKLQIAPAEFEGEDGHFSFDHAKYGVSDNVSLIGTANWDNAAFTKNREYIYVSNDPSVAKALSTIFVADFTNQSPPDVSSIDPNLVVSPGSKGAMVEAISQPGAVYIETEEVGSDPAILQAMEAKGAAAEIIVPSDGVKKKVRSELESYGVQIRVLHGLYAHAKAVIGSKYAFIGSENDSTTSLDYNREVGILTNDPTDLQTLSATFQTDWQNAQ